MISWRYNMCMAQPKLRVRGLLRHALASLLYCNAKVAVNTLPDFHRRVLMTVRVVSLNLSVFVIAITMRHLGPERSLARCASYRTLASVCRASCTLSGWASLHRARSGREHAEYCCVERVVIETPLGEAVLSLIYKLMVESCLITHSYAHDSSFAWTPFMLWSCYGHFMAGSFYSQQHRYILSKAH